jgi:uncharacterized membrane protein
MLTLAASAGTFVLLHFFPSTPGRRFAEKRLGEGLYLGLFSIVSLAALYWLTQEFLTASYGEKLWLLPGWWLWIKAALVLMASVFIVASYTTPNPTFPGAGKFLERPDVANGIFAITRHPLMWGIAIWAVSHLLTQATPRGILFFGAFAIVALVGAWLQERRKRRGLGEAWAKFERRTSFVPFAALLNGNAQFRFSALGLWRIALGVVLWAAILHFHAWLFGPSPLPTG